VREVVMSTSVDAPILRAINKSVVEASFGDRRINFVVLSLRQLTVSLIKDDAGDFLLMCGRKLDVHPMLDTWEASFENLRFRLRRERVRLGPGSAEMPYGLDIWAGGKKVLNIVWGHYGEPEIVTFRRGKWEKQVRRAVVETERTLRAYRAHLAAQEYVLGAST
jgi:hypothetical protein